jgi:hypothetical protein
LIGPTTPTSAEHYKQEAVEAVVVVERAQ